MTVKTDLTVSNLFQRLPTLLLLLLCLGVQRGMRLAFSSCCGEKVIVAAVNDQPAVHNTAAVIGLQLVLQ